MKYLLDANIWLEAALERTYKEDVVRLLSSIPGKLLATTDFAVHAVGIFISRRKPDLFERFLDDLIRNEVGVLHVSPSALYQVTEIMKATSLDFDDAFHVMVARRFDLKIVSLDADYDRLPERRLTPADVLVDHTRTSP